ncbi:hypothetical protein V8E51_003258, partial [Hyaloscypha variabilis]
MLLCGGTLLGSALGGLLRTLSCEIPQRHTGCLECWKKKLSQPIADAAQVTILKQRQLSSSKIERIRSFKPRGLVGVQVFFSCSVPL